jgi:O-acetyl-ADP-ribose deacetylase (regulator of RNase III)
VERAYELRLTDGRSVWLAYGDIACPSYLGHRTFGDAIRAVVSPGDTFLTIGGGVAMATEKARLRATLHEVSKFAPISQGESRPTSGGLLPVHYIMHAATIKIRTPAIK